MDVLIVEGGPAGLPAAITVGRLGARTMIIECYGSLGDVSTQVGVESFTWYHHSETEDCGGICREHEGRARALGFTRPGPQSISEVINTEGFKVVADQVITESGVEPLYHPWVVDVIKDGDTLCGVIVENKSDRGAILVKRVIDCTGDADIAARAGAPWTKRSRDQLMGVTVMFSCAGVDVARFSRFAVRELKPTYTDQGKDWMIQITGKGDLMFSPHMEDILTHVQQDGVILSDAQAITGTWSTFSENGETFQTNMVYAFGFNCTDVFDLTKAEIVGRQ